MNQQQEAPTPEMLVKGYQLQQLANLYASCKELKVRLLLMDAEHAIAPNIAEAFLEQFRSLVALMDSIAHPPVPQAPTPPTVEGAKAS